MKKLLWAGAAAFALYELHALRTKEHGDTISEQTWRWSRRPLIPFLAGALAGHLFWQSQDVYEKK